MAPPVAAVASIPVAAPLVAVPAVVELTIVAVPVPLARSIGAVGAIPVRTIRSVWPLRIWSIRALRTIRSVPVGPIRTAVFGSVGASRRLRPRRTVGPVPFRTIRALRMIGPVRLLRPLGTIGSLAGWTVRPVAIWPLRALSLGGGALRSLRAALELAFLALRGRYGAVALLTLRSGASFRTASAVLARVGPVLGHDGQRRGGGNQEAGGGREHEERTFHDHQSSHVRQDGLMRRMRGAP
ncbi:hypothetical protein EGK63_10335 [Brevundimonas sp. 357]|nr:hypothetical protein EGK63_10335 [Brevundimonas sp. 357]